MEKYCFNPLDCCDLRGTGRKFNEPFKGGQHGQMGHIGKIERVQKGHLQLISGNQSILPYRYNAQCTLYIDQACWSKVEKNVKEK